MPDQPLPAPPQGGAVETAGCAASGAPAVLAGVGNVSGGESSVAGAPQGAAGLMTFDGGLPVGCNWTHSADDTWSMNAPASDKEVLFDGSDLSQWHRLNQPTTPAQWNVLPGGMMEVVPQATPTNIQSNAKFDDVCLHVEYWTPAYGSGVGVQMQGNSGVYLRSAYELQVLDTSQLGPLIDGCGAVYKVSAPLVVACTPHETWNTYEIEFKAAIWDTNAPPKKTKDAVLVQAALNGQLVQRNVILNPPGGATEAGIPDVAGPQPLALQDHRERVRYRNIWATVPRY